MNEHEDEQMPDPRHPALRRENQPSPPPKPPSRNLRNFLCVIAILFLLWVILKGEGCAVVILK